MKTKMKIKIDERSEDLEHFKIRARQNDSYYLNIFYEGKLNTINLSEEGKNIFFFGKSDDNDIVIKSNNIDNYQGKFEITESGVLVTNQSQRFEMISNGNKPFDDIYLEEGEFIKIVDPFDKEWTKGILFIMSIGETMDEWKSYSLQLGVNTLGSGAACDIRLPPNGVEKRHATITRTNNKLIIKDKNSVNGTLLNGYPIFAAQGVLLNDLDVIFIGNSKLIIYKNKVFYQIYVNGMELYAIDIVKKVRIKFKEKQIASHVNMHIKPAEFVAFVGGSGAGKTTFMKCISGVEVPTSGSVLLNGEDLYENYETLKYGIGYVPQEDIVYSDLTLRDMLRYTAKLRMPDNATKKERNARVKEVLEIVRVNWL